MNKKVRIWSVLMVCLLSLVLLMQGLPLQESGKVTEPASLVEGNTTFALELYREIKETKGNLFFSPYSISTALAMTHAGARGETAAQMAEALNFTLDKRGLHPAFGGLQAGLNAVQDKGDIQLHVANSLWPQEGYPFLKEYLTLVKTHYGVTITPVDYKQAAGAACKKINRWVEEKTKDKIKNLIQPGVLDALTRMVLVNAIYFKGNWAHQFDPEHTKDAPFYLLPEKTVQVPMMTRKEKYKYAEDQSLQVLELPYVGNDLSMLVLLPKKKDGLSELEEQFTPETLTQWTAGLRVREVRVFLPKFKLTSQFRLDKALVALGMRDAFDPQKANFSGMDGRSNWLYIGAVLHKAFVDVNEEGTEAAAATSVIMRVTMAAPPPLFRADHPFLFLIRENKSGSILFLGRLTDPAEKGK